MALLLFSVESVELLQAHKWVVWCKSSEHGCEYQMKTSIQISISLKAHYELLLINQCISTLWPNSYFSVSNYKAAWSIHSESFIIKYYDVCRTK